MSTIYVHNECDTIYSVTEHFQKLTEDYNNFLNRWQTEKAKYDNIFANMENHMKEFYDRKDALMSSTPD